MTNIIVALDGMEQYQAAKIVDRIGGSVWGFKVNDLLLRIGAPAIGWLRECGAKNIMLDPKCHDIPNTVANYMAVLNQPSVSFITVHASGGQAMLEAAVKAAPNKVLAVTVLTSLDDVACHDVYGATVDSTVQQFVETARDAGCAGVVCSPKELRLLSEKLSLCPVCEGTGARPVGICQACDNGTVIVGVTGCENMAKVVPGIRPAWAHLGDQKRTMTPKEAVEAGATHLVIGRPIYQDGDPLDNVKRIGDELSD